MGCSCLSRIGRAAAVSAPSTCDPLPLPLMRANDGGGGKGRRVGGRKRLAAGWRPGDRDCRAAAARIGPAALLPVEPRVSSPVMGSNAVQLSRTRDVSGQCGSFRAQLGMCPMVASGGSVKRGRKRLMHRAGCICTPCLRCSCPQCTGFGVLVTPASRERASDSSRSLFESRRAVNSTTSEPISPLLALRIGSTDGLGNFSSGRTGSGPASSNFALRRCFRTRHQAPHIEQRAAAPLTVPNSTGMLIMLNAV